MVKKLFIAALVCAAALTAMAKTEVVAHRGYWKAPGSAQNSIRSIVKADSINCWGSEFDVWMTTDGELFVNHDGIIGGDTIEFATAKEIRRHKLENGEYIPTLDQYLKTAKKLKTKLVCELKPHADKDLETKAVKKILKSMKKYGLENRVVYITFARTGLEKLIAMAPKGTEVYYLTGELTPQQLKDMGAAGMDYHYSVFRKHPDWYKQCHDLGLKVNVWTVNTADVLQEVIEAGADFITTNSPELTQYLLKEDTPVPPCSKKIVSTGRINKNNPLSYLFVYPGTSFKANFKGSGIDMKVKPGSGYFEVVIDNLNPHKVYAGANDSIINLASGLGEGIHQVEVSLIYEGYAARPEFRGFMPHKGAMLVDAPEQPKLKLEFIGNSITCGYGIEAPDKSCPFRDSTENHYYTYAALTARALNAQEMCVARSGIGIYRNYNGKDAPNTMERWYDYTCLLDTTDEWDFEEYRPDIICINLGTNDLSTKPHDVNLYEKAYLKFVRHLHEVQPQAKIVALTGSMLGGEALKEQKTALNNIANIVKDEGIKYYRFDMSEQDGSLGYGAGWHPSLKQHEKMASELIPFLRQVIAE
ncbi:MAG: hypothetical protein KBT10_03505 [Bacteroidales bacterium]|nr:hypothetical protein [Candidatus Sodaliphilus aphodohippi]